VFTFSGLVGAESRNPENVRSAMPIQGVSTRMFVLRFPARARTPLQVLGLHPDQPAGALYVGVTGFFDKRIHQHSVAKSKLSAGAGKRKSG
jgi:hypothetical protein